MNMVARTTPSANDVPVLLERSDPNWRKLHAFIDKESLIFGDFTLASGRNSKYLFRLSQTTMSGEAMAIVCDAILGLMKRLNVRTIGGLEIGAVPIAAAVSLAGFAKGTPVDAFYVRKARKEHGARQLIEGHLKRGAEAIVVDDVTTGGGSVIKAIQGARSDFDCKIRYALSIVDREQGASEALAAEGVTLLSFFKGSDFNLNR
jgi:orotate phosphoribosyltransferase